MIIGCNFETFKILIVDCNLGPSKITILGRNFVSSKILIKAVIFACTKLQLWAVILDFDTTTIFILFFIHWGQCFWNLAILNKGKFFNWDYPRLLLQVARYNSTTQNTAPPLLHQDTLLAGLG